MPESIARPSLTPIRGALGPLGGDGHGPVLLYPGPAPHGRSPPLEFGSRRMDRDTELRRLLHRHPRHRPRLGRTQPIRLPPQPHRLHRGSRRGRPDPEPHLAGRHPHDRRHRLGADLRVRDPTHSRELPQAPRRRHLLRRSRLRHPRLRSHRARRRQRRRLAPAVAHLRGRVRDLLHHRLDMADPRPESHRSTTPAEAAEPTETTTDESHRRSPDPLRGQPPPSHGHPLHRLLLPRRRLHHHRHLPRRARRSRLRSHRGRLDVAHRRDRHGSLSPDLVSRRGPHRHGQGADALLLPPGLRRPARGLRLHSDRPDHRRRPLRLHLHRGGHDDDRRRHTDGSRERLGEADVLVQHRSDRRPCHRRSGPERAHRRRLHRLGDRFGHCHGADLGRVLTGNVDR